MRANTRLHDLQLRPEIEQLIQKQIERGAYSSIEEFVERAIQLLHDEEQLRNSTAVKGIPGDVSRKRLQEKKARWIDAGKRS